MPPLHGQLDIIMTYILDEYHKLRPLLLRVLLLLMVKIKIRVLLAHTHASMFACIMPMRVAFNKAMHI